MFVPPVTGPLFGVTPVRMTGSTAKLVLPVVLPPEIVRLAKLVPLPAHRETSEGTATLRVWLLTAVAVAVVLPNERLYVSLVVNGVLLPVVVIEIVSVPLPNSDQPEMF